MPDRRTVHTPPTDPAVARARWALMGLFALSGLMFSSWLTRLPSVRDALGMSAAELGGVLLAGAVGALLTVTVAGAVVTRWGGRVALVLSSVGFAVAYTLLGIGPTVGAVPLLVAGVFLNGVSFAIGNVPLNVESAAVERRLGRTVLPHFHAAFSIGAVLGSLLGAAMAQLGVGLLAQFTGTALVGLVWRLASIPHVVLDTLPQHRRDAGPPARRGGLRTALGAWRERRTVLIGLVIMSAALSEGSANDWLALAVVDGFAQTEAVGAVVFGVFVAAMTVVRLLGTRLIDRFGRVTVLRVSGGVSLAGLLVFGFGPNLAIAGAGVVAWGLGAALAVPIGLAAASDDPLRAAGRVAVVSAFSSLAHLAAPPLLGLVAQTVGARHALLLITGAMVVSIALSGQVARPTAGARPAVRRAVGETGPQPSGTSPGRPASPVVARVPSPRGGQDDAGPVGSASDAASPHARPGDVGAEPRPEHGPGAGRAAHPDGAHADRPQPPRPHPACPQPARPNPARPHAARPNPARPNPARPNPVRPNPVRPNPARQLPTPTPEQPTRGGHA